jgi:hypothetical protein
MFGTKHGDTKDFSGLNEIKSLMSEAKPPMMKEFKVLTDGSFIFGIEIIYR